jgi:hypothetical protein
MLRKLKWQILAARYNWCQGPIPGRGPAVEKHCSTSWRNVWECSLDTSGSWWRVLLQGCSEHGNKRSCSVEVGNYCWSALSRLCFMQSLLSGCFSSRTFNFFLFCAVFSIRNPLIVSNRMMLSRLVEQFTKQERETWFGCLDSPSFV